MKDNITLNHIAGYATEKTVWLFILNLSAYCNGGDLCGITADEIIVSDSAFIVQRHSQQTGHTPSRFSAPESSCVTLADHTEASGIWTLGALAFYAITGMDVFEGKGGSTQTKETIVPRIASAYASEQLSSLICQCLSYSPADRPSVECIAHLAKEALGIPTAPRKRLINSSGRCYATSLVKFWPEEMVPVWITLMLIFSSLSLSAQNGAFDKAVVPNEMVNLVMRCIDLRSPANTEKVRQAMDRDMNWTVMDELPVDKQGECTTKQAVDMLGINDICFGILKRHGGITNSGGRFRDGRDPRYKYSLIEVTVKSGGTVNYMIDGREGMQMFAVVPFDKGTSYVASIPGGSSFMDNGVCYIQLKQALKKADKFQLTIKNESGRHVAFTIINYNSRNHE